MGKQTLDTNKTIAKVWVWEGGSVTAFVWVCLGLCVGALCVVIFATAYENLNVPNATL